MAKELTDEMLKAIMPNAPRAKRAASLPILNKVMADYAINNERRAAAWLATLAIESGELKYQQEIADGSAYEGRRDLGNTQPGDGKRFKGRGRIQITGRSNYTAYTNYLRGKGHLEFFDFIAKPKLLAEEPYATDSAGWFWAVLHDLNSLADKRNFLKTQTKVNGRNRKTGLPNHWTERKAYYERGLRVLPDDFLLEGAEIVEDDAPADFDELEIDEPVKDDRSELENDSEKGITTSTKPANETEGTPPPAPAAEIKASQPSLFSKITALSMPVGAGTVISGIWTFAKSIPPWGWGILGGIFVISFLTGIWYLNESQKRAQQRTLMVGGAAADKEKNNLRLI